MLSWRHTWNTVAALAPESLDLECVGPGSYQGNGFLGVTVTKKLEKEPKVMDCVRDTGDIGDVRYSSNDCMNKTGLGPWHESDFTPDATWCFGVDHSHMGGERNGPSVKDMSSGAS